MESIVYLALPGYLAILTIRLFSRSRSRTGWDFLVATGLFGALAFFVARLLVVGTVMFPSVRPTVLQVNQFIDLWITEAKFAGTYALSWLVAPILGFCWYKISHSDFVSTSLWRLGARHLPKEVDSLIQIRETSYPVVVSTSSGQVYIGKVREVTTDPDETLRILELIVLAGGARVEDGVKRQVKYNYVFDVRKERQRVIYLEFRGIISIAEFGLEEFVASRQSGYTDIDEEKTLRLIKSLVSLGYAHEPNSSKTGSLTDGQAKDTR